MTAKRTDRPESWKEKYVGGRVGPHTGWYICVCACMRVAAYGLEVGSFQL